MNVDQNFVTHGIFNGFYDFVRGLWLQQRGHVLDADRVTAHVDQLLSH
jgi:hypothetical protein